MLKKLLLTAAVAGAMVVPVPPAQATTCAAQDPLVEYVVCDIVWATVAPIGCKVKLWCY
jgi:hypothetical protein